MFTTQNKIDFSNTEVAFKDKTSNELRQSHLLFRVMNNNAMVKLGKKMVNFAFAIHLL